MPKHKRGVSTKPGKRPMGRPTGFRPEYTKMLLEYFHQAGEPNTRQVNVSYFKDGSIKSKEVTIIPSRIPLLERFAEKIGKHRDLLHAWATRTDDDGKLLHPEFHDAYMRAKQIQAAHLTENGLLGLYNAQFASLFAMNNLDWKTKGDVTSDGKQMLTADSIIAAAEAARAKK